MLFRSLPFLVLLLLLTGCASTKKRQPTDRQFAFERDTFVFANELLWEYEFNPAKGELETRARVPEPEFHHYCFPMVRAARQFYDFAEFRPDADPDAAAIVSENIEAVLDRGVRSDPDTTPKVVFNGYSGLRELSREFESELKNAMGGKWQSWFQRGHWRVVFPFSRGGQEDAAAGLIKAIQMGQAPVVHLVRFPALTINHAVIIFGFEEFGEDICFHVYDPNTPEEPLQMTFGRGERTFWLPATPYWQGGRVDVYEVYTNWMY